MERRLRADVKKFWSDAHNLENFKKNGFLGPQKNVEGRKPNSHRKKFKKLRMENF